MSIWQQKGHHGVSRVSLLVGEYFGAAHTAVWGLVRKCAKRCSPPLLALLMISVSCGFTSAADEFPGIKALMSEADFKETGLDQLSAKQLQALDTWLLNYTAGTGQVLQQTEAVRQAQEAFEIISTITGEFSGWTGATVFRLENGQRWRQRLSGRYFHQGELNPRVKITRNFFGFYKLTLLDYGQSIGVSPLP